MRGVPSRATSPPRMSAISCSVTVASREIPLTVRTLSMWVVMMEQNAKVCLIQVGGSTRNDHEYPQQGWSLIWLTSSPTSRTSELENMHPRRSTSIDFRASLPLSTPRPNYIILFPLLCSSPRSHDLYTNPGRRRHGPARSLPSRHLESPGPDPARHLLGSVGDDSDAVPALRSHHAFMLGD